MSENNNMPKSDLEWGRWMGRMETRLSGIERGQAAIQAQLSEHKGRVYAEPADPGLKIIVELPKGEAEGKKRDTTLRKASGQAPLTKNMKDSQRGI